MAKDAVSNPRIAKLIELEVAGRIKPEHQVELDTYRAQGLAPKSSSSESERTAAFLATRVAAGVRKLREIGVEGNPTAGSEAASLFGKWGNAATPEARQRARDAQLDVLDAALTLGTGAAYNKEQLEAYRQSYFPQIGDKPGLIADKEERLRVILEAARVKAGASAPEIDAALAAVNPMPPQAAPVTTQATGTPEVITDGTQRRFSTEEDKAFAALAEETFKNGGSRADFDALATKYGRSAFGPELDDALKRRETGGVVVFNPNQSGVEDVSAAERAAGVAATSGVGGAIAGSANGLMLGGADEVYGAASSLLTGKPLSESIAEADLKKSIIADRNPGEYMAGNIGGGVLSSFLAPAAGAGKGILAGRAIATDAGLSAVSGALEDNADRGRGVLSGLAYGVPGGIAGRTLGRVIAPTGGASKPLYDAGVRPTPGQRFGGPVNVVEEAVGSIPVIGSAIRSTRQGARDQFERGAFNKALGEIGIALPADTRLGTPAHKFTQRAFNEAYDRARSGMTFARDAEFDQNYAALADSVATELPETSAQRFRSIIKDQVDLRMRNNMLDGDAYKKAMSNIGKRIRAIRNNQAGDQELADALDDFTSLLDAGARRASPAEAVAQLDAADKGYAWLVRVESASNTPGSAGRFTPTQFANAVRREAGGRATRSKAYLAGDALGQEYADAGLRLNDVIPDSGTPVRSAVAAGLTGAAGGAGYLSPAALAAPVALSLPYLPGIRRATTGALAPRQNKAAGALGNYLVDGRLRASGALALYGSGGN